MRSLAGLMSTSLIILFYIHLFSIGVFNVSALKLGPMGLEHFTLLIV